MRTSHPLLGHELGGYTLQAVLGSGGMGTVFEALDGGGRRVALKLLHPGFSHDEEARRRLRREVATLHRVRGAGVAQVIDAELESDHAFIVTELIDGDTLEASVAQMGPLGAAELSDFAVGMAVALGSIHAVGVIHRDLKPSNVMLTEEGPVLIDFGISQAMDDTRITSTGLVTGTPGYVDPAVVGGTPVSIAADWWGWAAVLVFAATGQAPFGTGPWPAVLARVNQGQPALEGVPEPIAAPLRAALHPDPQLRMSPATVLEHLEQAAAAHDAPTTWVADMTEQPSDLPGQPSAEVPMEQLAPPPVVMPPRFEPASTRAADHQPGAPHNQGSSEPAPQIPPTRVFNSPPVQNQPPPAPTMPAHPVQANPMPAPVAHHTPQGTDPQWWQLAAGQTPAWAQRPASRPGIAAAWWLAATAVSILRPGVVLMISAVLVVVLGTIGANRRSFRMRRWQRGVKKTDGAITLMKLPWHVLQAIFVNIPGVILGVASGAIIWLLVDMPEYQGLIAAAAVAVLLLMVWSIPSAALVREGAWHMLRAAARPRWTAVWVVLPLAIAIISVLLGMGGQWQEVWDPFPTPPRLS